MAHVGALIAGRDIRVTDGVYLERRDQKDNAIEVVLRDGLARLPKRRGACPLGGSVPTARGGVRRRR